MKAVSKTHILYSYLIIPIGLLIVLLDGAFFSYQIKSFLPYDPHMLFLLNLIFGLPHVMAGDIQLLDREYANFHGVALIFCVLFSLVAPFTIVMTLGIGILIFLDYLISAVHAAGQQAGITAMFSNFDRKYFPVWKWSIRLSLGLTAFGLVDNHDAFLSLMGGPVHSIFGLSLEAINQTLIFIILITGLHMMRGADKTIGKVYIGSNIALCFFFYFFLKAGYPFLTILCLRVPHDMTAFMFYINHSTLRNEDKPRNWLVKTLRVPKKLGGYYLLILCIPLAFFIENWKVAFMFDAFLSYLHYTSEIFAWKSTSPSIKYVKVV